MPWDSYQITGYDELFASPGVARPAAVHAHRALQSLTMAELLERQAAADLTIRSMGVTFRVYDGTSAIDRAWPFDVIPRILGVSEWDVIESGLAQRLVALNRFLADVYGDQEVLHDGVVPKELVLDSPNFRPECMGIRPPLDVWAHICGSDLVRGADGTMHVLEDNLRVPSGVSYLLENRQVTKRVFAELFRDYSIQPVDGYTGRLHELLVSLAPERTDPCVVVLTPGPFNSAYFEHAYLAQAMGIALVTGDDLYVDDDVVFVRTIDGPARVDVIYRRIDDMYLDPEVLRTDSVVGVPGLLQAWQRGNVALVNAPGAGVADDKAVYAFVPDIIRYYLDAEPILANVPTWRCAEPDHLAYVLDHIDELVVKPANESGGYGVVIGPHASDEELAACSAQLRADPGCYIAQPVVELSTVPTLCDDVIAARHVDLRPFVLTGRDVYVTRGGLTRVALTEGSLIVNSSQGGGSKDTWIVDEEVRTP